MKKIFTAAAAALVIASCTSDLSSLNVNSKAPEQVPAGALIANSTVSLTDYLTSVNVNLNNFILWSQHWTQTTYTDESNFLYNGRDVNGNTFDAMYATVLRDLSDARKFIEADDKLLASYKENQLAIVEVMEVYTYHVLVDIFGDVPYSEAIGDDVTPKYDNDAEIYTDLVSRLLAAHSVLGGDNGLGSYDLIYGGDSDSWKKFAASLALKLAIRAADVNPSAQSVASAAVAAGVFTSSSDNAMLSYTSSPPNTNPLWDDLVQSGRADFCAANTFADVLNGLNDPRRGSYFRNLDSAGGVIGAAYGLASSYANHSQPGDALEDATRAAALMDFTEVEFLLADAAARGWSVGGTAADHYAAAVTSSIEDWGGSATDAAAYLAQTDVAWDATMWKERIGVQKWIAMYTRGNEAWATQRMYDYPAMNVAVEALISTPTRMSYGIDEYSLNFTNVSAARGGNDDQMGKVFWDAN
ncbi:MAG: SusD/RagB family nutrient-binding outer membrane lipoprotein [Cryomorphaceae bacterium]|nr:SusD/RagB family nutrient-binding outer membrane lipoprotein [Cryomorphaceae bacterium]